ncbi:MAG: efflux RND transporter periplasmic adaptor subunit [Puniceicoccaceae bacterium]
MHEPAITHPEDLEDSVETSSRFRRARKWIIWGFVAVLLAVGIYQFFSNAIPVAYVSRAEQKTARDIVFGIAELSDVHTLTLRFERGGTVLNDQVSIGQDVARGQLLMQLDTEELELAMELLMIEEAYQETEGKLPRDDEIELRRKRGGLRRTAELLSQGRIPQEELEKAERELAQAEDNLARRELREELDLKTLQNNIEKTQYSLDRMELHSPIDGTIVEVMARKGDHVQQGQAVIRMIDERRLIVGLISETDYDRVKVGYPVELRLKAFPNTVFQGEVAQILPTANPETQKFEIYIDAEMAPEQRVPGLTGEIIVIADSRPNAVVVPSQAVYEGHVLVVENRRIRKQPVTIGFSNLLEIEILEGLKPGEIVVTESNHQFKDGQLVRMEWEHLNPLRRFDN